MGGAGKIEGEQMAEVEGSKLELDGPEVRESVDDLKIMKIKGKKMC
jgi:hypothetical protein